MNKIRFEIRITFAYVAIGVLWIFFSDNLLQLIINNVDVLTHMQTYKGSVYVLITALLFYFFLKKHLNTLRNTEKELEKHKNNLEQLVESKTKELDATIVQLSNNNEELQEKNELIKKQNLELTDTLNNLDKTRLQLYQAEKMASLGVLTSGVAHEINNPLNYIAGGLSGLELYLNGSIDQNKELKLFINSIKTGVERASAIVSGLNQLSRSNQSYEEECPIHDIIDNCLTIIGSQLNNRIDVKKDYSEEEIIALGNSGQLHQAFINILVNACQSISEKGSIAIQTRKDDNEAFIQITDSGCGISKENLPKITDPFFTTKDPGKGTGLGLSITYNIIQAHKGKLHFESEVDKGTTVTISLPIKHQ